MNFGALLAGAGIARAAMDDARARAAEQTYRQWFIQSGIQDMDAKEALRPMRAERDRLRAEMDLAEARYKRDMQPQEQEIARLSGQGRLSDAQHKLAMQPGKQRLDETRQQTDLALAPGKQALAVSEQQGKRQEERLKQLARWWGYYRIDQQGALDFLNGSETLGPGRQFKRIEAGDVPMPNGQTTRGLAFIPADGGQRVAIPFAQLDALEKKYNTKYEKVGSTLVGIGPEGPKVVFSGAQQTHDLAVKKLDYEYSLKRELESFKQKNGAAAATALERNVRFLIDQGIAKTPAAAFEKLRTAMSKGDEDAVLSLAGSLLRGPGFSGPKGRDKAIAEAQRMIESIRGPSAPGASTYQSAEDVRAAYRAQKIDRATALKELERFGFEGE